MELVEGRSLRDVLREEGKVSSLRALELTARVLDALACSHGAGIIHRDIKPGNVMLTNTGGVKVADFGIARAVSDSSGTATMSGAVMGTAQYLAPEQARGETADVRSDIYSVGCLLYELLVGRPPFTGDSMVSIVFQHISDLPSPPSAANPDVSTDIDAITLKALAKEAGRPLPNRIGNEGRR
jgi:serine/threonine-protein kinase